MSNESILVEIFVREIGYYKKGVVVFHVASGYLFKKTIEKDETPKTAGGG